MLFALTDFLVVIGAGIGLWRLWPYRKDGRVRMVRLGLIALALAALIGTVRFAAGLDTELAPWHSLASDFAASAGFLLIALGAALALLKKPLPPAGTRYLRVGIPVVIAFFLVFPGLGAVADLIPPLALLLGLATGGALLTRKDWIPGVLWLASFGLVGVVSLALGGSREIATLGIANWHVYHAVLGLCAAGMGEATRRLYSHTRTRAAHN
ncbi:hypothetical protein [Maricaulis parjimensis]|uniref:hypothetical protein n=1 Tax=Maricaulis parjimensis TaxID=144023 RepID=UPI00193AC5A1|nr:hypothetical protein [Maricaulis parjimensis]